MQNTILFRHFCLFACVLVAIATGCEDSTSTSTSTTPEGNTVIERDGNPDVVYFDDDDELMDRAIMKAKETYQAIIDALESDDLTARGYSIKKRYEAGDGYEHLWISDVKWDGQIFTGKIGNEPVNVKGVVLGQPVEVKPEELTDWMYIREGKLIGGYTLRVVMSQYPPAEREAMQKQMGFDVPEVDF